VNSVKPLSEITGGNMMALPREWTLAPWRLGLVHRADRGRADGAAPYFINSLLMVVPAVVISTMVGALNGYVLTKWRFRGDTWVFGLMLFSCFIPFQIVLIPMAVVLGKLGLAGSIPGLFWFMWCTGSASPRFTSATTTPPSRPSWCAQPRSTGRGSSASSGASCCPFPDRSRWSRHLAVHQYLERLPVRGLVRGHVAADDRGSEQPRAVLDRA
jgi:hypothetical protein